MRRPDGSIADANKIANDARSYMMNPAKASRLISASGRFAFGRPTLDTLEGRRLNEIFSIGGTSFFGARFTGDRKKFVDGIMKQRKMGRAMRGLAQFIEGYNRAFDLSPMLGSYMAMRDNGLSPEQAAHHTLDTMNFRKKGTSMALPNAMFAFAQPSVMGGANMLGALFNKDGSPSKIGFSRLIGYTITLAGVQAFARMLVEDDEGGNQLDQVSDFVKDSNILIPMGKGIAKIPLPFSMVRVANSIAKSMVGVGTGNETPGEAFGKLAQGGVIPTFSPIEHNSIEWRKHPTQAFLATFSPTWMKPIMSVGINRNSFGSQVVHDKFEDTEEYKSEQFGKTIPPVYKSVAQFLRKSAGIDLAPEQVREFIRGYALGPGSMMLNSLVENPYREERGFKTDNAVLRTIYSGFSEYAIKNQFYNALERSEEILRRLNAGGELESEDDRKVMRWRHHWDKVDDDLRKIPRRISKSGRSDKAKEELKKAYRKKRDQAQVLEVYRYRQMMGLDARRVKVPENALR
jgi:hypothetical protein